MPIRIDELEIDGWNENECARHGVTARELRQVLDENPKFLPNKRGHAAPIVMIGRTYGGRLLTIPLAPSGRPNVWRPASGWDSSPGEAARYQQAGGK